MNALEKVVYIGVLVFMAFLGWNIGQPIGEFLVSGIDSIEARDESLRPAEVGAMPEVWCECYKEGWEATCPVE